MDSGHDVDVAIIGGGVIGASVAWHLSRSGVARIALIERHTIGSGSSSLAAGLVSLARSDSDILSMVRATMQDIHELESANGQSVGFHQTGSIRVAELEASGEQQVAMAELLHQFDIRASFIDGREAAERVPWLAATSACSNLLIPGDGYVDGQGMALAYVRAAKGRGVTVLNNTSVLAPHFERGELTGVETSRGLVRCERLVSAAGPWAGQVLGWFDHVLAATPLRSHYWITAPEKPPWPRHPIVVMPDAHAYVRPEVGGLLLGVQERSSRRFDDRTLPADMSQLVLTSSEDWDLLATHADSLRRYVPAFDTLQFKHHLAGVTTYTPDRRFLIGHISDVANAFVASGCCGTGVSCAGGIGRLVRDLVLGRPTEIDAERFAPDRFGDEDPRSDEFIARCVASRANKGTGL